jgi:hypothetical protein
LGNFVYSELNARIDNDFGFHPATDESRPRHEEVRKSFKALAHRMTQVVPAGRQQSLMLTALQEAAMWANAGIACELAPLEEE